jgi:hypothetical protein
MNNCSRNVLARLDSELIYGHGKVGVLIRSQDAVRSKPWVKAMAGPYSTHGVRSFKNGEVDIWMSLDVRFGEG